jgi:hypothetical protein
MLLSVVLKVMQSTTVVMKHEWKKEASAVYLTALLSNVWHCRSNFLYQGWPKEATRPHTRDSIAVRDLELVRTAAVII